MKHKEELRVPLYSHELIDKLDKQFPEKCITRAMTQFDAAHYAGMREIINMLVTWQKMDATKEDEDYVL